ncbi:cation:proton antiporter [Shewanella avicenniae]|uniref:Cation:proton antiporter n=1 Tax=Shewanella avicenniae TaxID=2814294 RepID=A0ABX7QM78_9GAMM|nr:monovalent cation:proton antiporter-2 (CPA2) family protein [Shewanella avicenniae]QSX32549.1 cation:proton antiporter [Shewanella avicenniae]
MAHQMLTQLLMMLLIAMLTMVLLRRLKVPPLLAYLLTGVISGPAGFNWISQNTIHSAAELGVVLLMFTLGLEFSIPKLWSMRRTVFGLGCIQMLLTTLLVTALTLVMINDLHQALVIGFAVALSSTAIVLKLLSDSGQLAHRHGELAVSVLLFQDLAVVPLLIMIPLLAEAKPGEFMPLLTVALIKGLAAFVVLMSVGKWLLPKLFDEVARSRINELFVLSALVVALTAGIATYWLGLSMALGAFLAGMMLGESQYRRQLEADIRPFKDLLMGLFFISIGMLMDIGHLIELWWQLILLTIGLVLLKALVIIGLMRLAGENLKTCFATAASLAQMGEFSFVILALAVNQQLLLSEVANLLVMSGVLSMAITPLLMRIATRKHSRFSSGKIASTPDGFAAGDTQVLILGFGRVGQVIARFLKQQQISYRALDYDPMQVYQGRAAGEPLFFGDSFKRSILKQAAISHAQTIIITFGQHPHIDNLVALCRQLAPNSKILVKTRDDKPMNQLKQAGADLVIPEVLEGSLMLVSQVLHHSGVPLSQILRLLENERRHQYPYLHGYFSARASDLTYEQLFALPLAAGAYVVGKTVIDIPWDTLDIKLTNVRRAGVEQEVDEQWQFATGDILLLQGVPKKLERAEQWLLTGL